MSCLESLKYVGEFGLLASATTALRLLRCSLNAPCVREVNVIPPGLGLEMWRCAIRAMYAQCARNILSITEQSAWERSTDGLEFTYPPKLSEESEPPYF